MLNNLGLISLLSLATFRDPPYRQNLNDITGATVVRDKKEKGGSVGHLRCL